jgi:GNAT superfamily N-acetyltransferase
MSHRIIRGRRTDMVVLSQVIASTFHDLPLSRWLIGDEAARHEVFPGYFMIFVEHALATGIVHTTPERTAVALWLPVGDNGPQPPDWYDVQLAGVTGQWIRRFVLFDAELDRHHLAGIAHHHLAILAVHPDHHNQGLGTALLSAHHTSLDKSGVPAYLEASSPRSRDLYLRHGYTPLPGAPFHLPEDGPPLWPMVRPPHHPAAGPGDDRVSRTVWA